MVTTRPPKTIVKPTALGPAERVNDFETPAGCI